MNTPDDLPPHLIHTTDTTPGYSRVRKGKGFAYRTAQGDYVRDARTRQRLEALGIPPAYTDVWICAQANGHLQASGRDERGRKQYIYHPEWTAFRNQTKFRRLQQFGMALPTLRERTDADLRQRGWPKTKVLALAVQLLDNTLLRVGNQDYAKENRTYGLTTLRRRHLEVNSRTVRFAFRGKSGVHQRVTLHNRRLARLVRQCADLPGQEVLQYLDEDGGRHRLDSGDINDYVREVTGAGFSAKDFRTWGGSVLALRYWEDAQAEACAGTRKKLEICLVRRVAKSLGNTVAVCRAYYIHPRVLEQANTVCVSDLLAEDPLPEMAEWLAPEERLLLHLISEQPAPPLRSAS